VPRATRDARHKAPRRQARLHGSRGQPEERRHAAPRRPPDRDLPSGAPADLRPPTHATHSWALYPGQDREAPPLGTCLVLSVEGRHYNRPLCVSKKPENAYDEVPRPSALQRPGAAEPMKQSRLRSARQVKKAPRRRRLQASRQPRRDGTRGPGARRAACM